MQLINIGTNQTEIRIDGKQMFFSYEQLVAVRNNDKCYVTSTKYSPSTTKHINKWIENLGWHNVGELPQEEIDAMPYTMGLEYNDENR